MGRLNFAHRERDGVIEEIGSDGPDLDGLGTDRDVRQALAQYFDLPVQKFAPYVVERHANGNITVRPEAVFG